MIEAAQDAELAAVVDSAWEVGANGEVCKPNAFCPQAKGYTSLSDALKEMTVDVVTVATPNGSHVELAMMALAAGCHVIVEKPMGLDSNSVKELHLLAQRLGKKVFGVMQNRYAPAAQWLKKTHDNGHFGDVLQVHVQCLWNRDDRYYTSGSWRGTLEHDGGPLFTQFSHFIDILMWVFGGIEIEEAHFVNQTHQGVTEFEDGGVVRFRIAQGGWGTLTFSTSAPHRNFESSMTVMGTMGTVRIGGQYMDRMDSFDMPNLEMPNLDAAPPPNDYGGYTGSASNHHHVYDNVIDVLLNEGEVATTSQEGVAVVEAIEAMNQLGRRQK